MNSQKMEAFITGIGWVSKKSMGNPTSIQLFENKFNLPFIKRKQIINNPYKPFGRMDTFSKLGFAAIAFAMDDAGITKEKNTKNPNNVSLIASTTTGCIETDIKYRRTMADHIPSPALFAYTLDSCFLGEASIYFNLTGESFVVNEEKTNGLKGFFWAMETIDSGMSDTALCGVCNSDMNIIDVDFTDIQDIPQIQSVQPGALFFVIEKNPLHSYGNIIATSPENFYYQNDIKISNLYDLAAKCSMEKI